MLWCGCEWDPRAMLETLPLFGWSTSPTSTLRPISRSRFYYSSIYSAIVFPHMGQQLCSSAPHGPTVPSAATNSSTLCYSSHSPPVSHWVFGCGDSRHCPSPGPRARLSFPPSQGSSSLPVSGSLQPWFHGSWVWELYESLVFLSIPTTHPCCKVSIFHLGSGHCFPQPIELDQVLFQMIFHSIISIGPNMGWMWSFGPRGLAGSHNIDGSVNHYISNQI